MQATEINIGAPLKAGYDILLTLENGTYGQLFIDNTYYPDEPQYMFRVLTGWAGGVTEPVCDVDDSYLYNEFLKGATVEKIVVVERLYREPQN